MIVYNYCNAYEIAILCNTVNIESSYYFKYLLISLILEFIQRLLTPSFRMFASHSLAGKMYMARNNLSFDGQKLSNNTLVR